MKYTKEIMEEAVKGCISYAQVLRKLKLKVTGGNHRTITKYIKLYDIDTSAFKGQSWANGQTAETNEHIRKNVARNKIPNEEIFVEKSSYTNSEGLRKRMIEDEGFEYKCDICNMVDWLGKPITLHIDHINGNHIDNRKNNLRFLCPCCHQQTATWGSNNRRKYDLDGVKYLCSCGNKKSKKAKMCMECYNMIRAENSTPPKCNFVIEKEVLEDLLKENSFVKIGKMYGVSDTTVRKRAKKFNLIYASVAQLARGDNFRNYRLQVQVLSLVPLKGLT